MILWIQKTKQAGTHPKTTKQPINHTLGQFYAVNVMLYRHTCMNASIIVAAFDISLLLKKKKKSMSMYGYPYRQEHNIQLTILI